MMSHKGTLKYNLIKSDHFFEQQQQQQHIVVMKTVVLFVVRNKSKAVPLHAMEALGGRGDIAPTHSRPRH
jgi:hypothetical protein